MFDSGPFLFSFDAEKWVIRFLPSSFWSRKDRSLSYPISPFIVMVVSCFQSNGFSLCAQLLLRGEADAWYVSCIWCSISFFLLFLLLRLMQPLFQGYITKLQTPWLHWKLKVVIEQRERFLSDPLGQSFSRSFSLFACVRAAVSPKNEIPLENDSGTREEQRGKTHKNWRKKINNFTLLLLSWIFSPNRRKMASHETSYFVTQCNNLMRIYLELSRAFTDCPWEFPRSKQV